MQLRVAYLRKVKYHYCKSRHKAAASKGKVMLFSEYKEKALEIMSRGFEDTLNKTKVFDHVLNHLNHVAKYYTAESGRVNLPLDRLETLEMDLASGLN